MKIKDVWVIEKVLRRIANPDTYVREALALVEREKAIRERQSMRGKENKDGPLELG